MRFKEEELAALRRLDQGALFLAIVQFVGGGIFAVAGCLMAIGTSAAFAASVSSGVVGCLTTVLALAMAAVVITQGIFLIRSRGTLNGIDGADPGSLERVAAAIESIRRYFVLEVVIAVVMVLLAAIGLVGAGPQSFGPPGSLPIRGL